MTPSQPGPDGAGLAHLLDLLADPARSADDGALAELCRVAAAWLNAARASLWLRDDAGDLACRACQGAGDLADLRGNILDSRVLTAPEGLGETGLLAIEDLALDNRAAAFPAPGRRGGHAALLAARIVAGGEYAGLILAEARGTQRRWDNDERQRIAVFAALAALGLETARRSTAQAGWQASERRYIDLLNNLVEGVFQLDGRGRLQLANPALAAMLGYADPESVQLVYNAEPASFFEPPQAWRDLMRRLRREGTVNQQVVRLARPDGKRLDVAISARTACDAQGRIRQVDGTVTDVTERRRVEDRLRQIAYTDPVTGLANRAGVMEKLRDYDRSALAVLLVDLDEFQTVNDSLGLEVGDFILYRLGQRLAGLDARLVAIGRTQADVFLLVLKDVDRAGAEAVLGRLQDALQPPVSFGQGSVPVRATAGLALVPPRAPGEVEPRPGPEELFRRAGVALKRAKRAERGGYRLYEGAMDRALKQRLETVNRIAEAVQAGAFEALYQPQVALPGGQVVAAEALARWRQQDGNLLTPAAFIDAAEESGQIAAIGEAVLRAGLACRQRWVAAGYTLPCLAFNLSPRQLRDPGFAERVGAMLDEAGCPPGAIELEVTETALMADLERGVRVLEALRALGVRLAVDDFGTGYSSLAYLNALPLDKLKIDRSFVADLEDGERAHAIVATVIRLGHDVGLEVVAEGVETAGQLARLQAAGAELAQGFYFARALPAAELEAYLKHGSQPERI